MRGQAHLMPVGEHVVGTAVVDVRRREIDQPAVMVCVVVPVEEIVTHAPRVLDRSKPIGKLRPILERAKLRFRERIVIADARPGVARLDPEIREQQRDELAAHRRAAVGVDRQLMRTDALLVARRLDEALGQVGILLPGDHPAHDVATEEIQDHIQSEAAATFTVSDFRGHDLRRTAASIMASGGIPRLTISKILNHVERNITAVYDRHSYDPEKRAALDWWDVKLHAILDNKDSAKVLAFAR